MKIVGIEFDFQGAMYYLVKEEDILQFERAVHKAGKRYYWDNEEKDLQQLIEEELLKTDLQYEKMDEPYNIYI